MKKALGAITLAVIMMTGLGQAQEDCSDHDFYWHNNRHQHHCNPLKPLPVPPVQPLHELTTVDYAALAAYTSVLRSEMKNPDSFVFKGALYHYYGPRTEAEAAIAARQCAKDTWREDNVPKCIAKYDAEVAKYNATKLCTIDFCVLYKATNSYGAYLEDSSCGLNLWPNPSFWWTDVPTAPPPAVTPAEQAKQAQAYADCLKLAVDNPKIVCKQ